MTKIPNEQVIISVIHSMTKEKPLNINRFATGDQNFVYAVTTSNAEYVLRMTNSKYRHKFKAAIAWQKMLLPLGIPLAEFINSDLDGRYSPFPALLMMRLPGDDLINVYSFLDDVDKNRLANEMVNIQALCNRLKEGPGYGIFNSYEDISEYNTWHMFLIERLEFYREHINKYAIFNSTLVLDVLKIANDMKENFRTVRAKPFLWDASERNVLVHDGKISGIIDVDEICFGDPLFVIALTSTCLQLEGFDTLYTDFWEYALHLDNLAQDRLNFYRLFYSVAFMKKQSMQTANNKKILFDTEILLKIFQDSLDRMYK